MLWLFTMHIDKFQFYFLMIQCPPHLPLDPLWLNQWFTLTMMYLNHLCSPLICLQVVLSSLVTIYICGWPLPRRSPALWTFNFWLIWAAVISGNTKLLRYGLVAFTFDMVPTIFCWTVFTFLRVPLFLRKPVSLFIFIFWSKIQNQWLIFISVF